MECRSILILLLVFCFAILNSFYKVVAIGICVQLYVPELQISKKIVNLNADIISSIHKLWKKKKLPNVFYYNPSELQRILMPNHLICDNHSKCHTFHDAQNLVYHSSKTRIFTCYQALRIDIARSDFKCSRNFFDQKCSQASLPLFFSICNTFVRTDSIAKPLQCLNEGINKDKNESKDSLWNNQNRSSLENIGVIILAGGTGSRMKSSLPKQYLRLLDREVIQYSIDLARSIQGVTNIVIVADPQYHLKLKNFAENDTRLCFACPGKERQDSVWNGMCKIPRECSLVAIHDAARPCISRKDFLSVLEDGRRFGCAILAVPVKPTIKFSIDGQFVKNTLDRAKLWDVQTPQVVRPSVLRQGYDLVREKNLTVTDDASIVELLGKPVKITKGSDTNIKITTSEELDFASNILKKRVSST